MFFGVERVEEPHQALPIVAQVSKGAVDSMAQGVLRAQFITVHDVPAAGLQPACSVVTHEEGMEVEGLLSAHRLLEKCVLPAPGTD